jgi:hypothetical protein
MNFSQDVFLRAVPYKLNMYTVGGMFKAHRDTPKGPNHVGTLNLCIPTAEGFKGGELVIRHNKQVIKSDWASTMGADQIGWTFLYPDCDHEVLPVTEGVRITLAYDVFRDAGNAPGDADVRILSSVLKSTLANPSFYPDGGYLGFGLQHDYPCNSLERKNSEAQGAMLKGADASWLAAIQACGLKWEIVGVYDYDYDDYETEVIYMDSAEDKPPAYKDRRYLNNSSFYAMEDIEFGEGDCPIPWLYENNCMKGDNVAWVTKPGVWGSKNSYITYGNEVSDAERRQLTDSGVRTSLMCLLVSR